MIKYILIGFIGVIVAAVAQIILKYGATSKANSKTLAFFINFYTISGYFLMFVVTLINLFIFRFLDLKYALIFLPSTYILVLLFSKIFLHEKFTKKNIISYSLIILGIIVFNLPF